MQMMVNLPKVTDLYNNSTEISETPIKDFFQGDIYLMCHSGLSLLYHDFNPTSSDISIAFAN